MKNEMELPRTGYEILADSIDVSELREKLTKTLIEHAYVVEGLMRLDRCYQGALSGCDHRGVAIVGESGTGKSRLIEFFENKHPRYRTQEGLIVPALRAKVPARPTVKGVASHLLYELGDECYAKGTEQEMTVRLLRLFKHSKVRMLMLDEFNHFVDQTTYRVQHHVADWLKMLVDDSGVALVVSGIESCLEVMQTNSQLKRRLQSPLVMPRFDWDDIAQQDEFRSILAAYQSILEPLNMPDLSAEDMAFRFYVATGGLIGRVNNLFLELINIALKRNIIDIGIEELHLASINASFDMPLGIADPFSEEFAPYPNPLLLKKIRNEAGDENVESKKETKASRRRKTNNTLSRR